MLERNQEAVTDINGKLNNWKDLPRDTKKPIYKAIFNTFVSVDLGQFLLLYYSSAPFTGLLGGMERCPVNGGAR